jgi:hypothetical protein
MQLGLEILKFLFFPGLLFMAGCGGLLLYTEGWLQAAFFGGAGPSPREVALGEAGRNTSTAGELTALAATLAAMGVAGVMVVGVRGDLFALLLLFSAVEVLPIYLVAARGAEQSLYVPLFLREALCRMATLMFVVLSVSLRFPGALSPQLETLRGEGAPYAAQLWSGTGFAIIVASLSCAGLAYLMFLLGRPAYAKSYGAGRAYSPASFHAGAIEGSHKAASVLLGLVLFLGYPWEGGAGTLLWAAAVLGAVALLCVARAWMEGRGRVFARRLQWSAMLVAMLSAALAFAAAIINGSWG